MNTEKTKNYLADTASLNGDFPVPTAPLVFLCPITLQNPRAQRGFCDRTDGQVSPHPIRPLLFPCPKFPCPIWPHSRTAASRPSRWASAVRLRGLSLGSVPLCVPSALGGVPFRATTSGAFPENTAESGRNAERERAAARTAYSLRRRSEFCLHPGRPTRSAFGAAPPLCTTTLQNPRAPRGFSLERGCVRGAPAAAAGSQGTARISPVPCGDSGPLRLVLGGHSRAPWVAAPPPCVHRASVVHPSVPTG